MMHVLGLRVHVPRHWNDDVEAIELVKVPAAQSVQELLPVLELYVLTGQPDATNKKNDRIWGCKMETNEDAGRNWS